MAPTGLFQGLADMAALPPQAARLFVLGLAPVCLWVALSGDFSRPLRSGGESGMEIRGYDDA